MTQVAKKVLKNSMFNSLGNLITKAGGLVLTVILARLFTPELFGIYHLALAIGFLVTTFTDLGINQTLIRYVADALGKGDETLARSYFNYLFKLKVLLAVVLSLSILFSAESLALTVFHKPLLALPLKVISLFIFLQSLLSFSTNSFVALQRFEYTTVRWFIYECSRLILVPLFIILGFSVGGALIGLSLSMLLTLIIIVYLLAKNYRFLLTGRKIKIERRLLVRFMGYLSIGSVSGIVFAYVDSIMLGIFLPAEFVGFYRAAYNFIFAVAGLISIVGVLFPVFTQLEGEELKNAFNRVFKYSIMLAFPCAFGLLFIAEPVIKLVYGAEYLPAVLPLFVLAFLIITASTDFFGILFNAKGKPEYPAKLAIISSVLNVILNYFLILRYGMIGAAFATVISRYLNLFALGILSKRVLNIAPDPRSIVKPLFSSLTMAAVLYVIPRPATLVSGIVGIVVAALVYFSVLYAVKGIGREDWEYVRKVIG